MWFKTFKLFTFWEFPYGSSYFQHGVKGGSLSVFPDSLLTLFLPSLPSFHFILWRKTLPLSLGSCSWTGSVVPRKEAREVIMRREIERVGRGTKSRSMQRERKWERERERRERPKCVDYKERHFSSCVKQSFTQPAGLCSLCWGMLDLPLWFLKNSNCTALWIFSEF